MSKAKGARIERKVKAWIEKAGYYAVKAGGSLGAFDLVAVKPQCAPLLLQVKGGKRPRVSLSERLCLQNWANVLGPGYDVQIVCWTDYAREPVFEKLSPVPEPGRGWAWPPSGKRSAEGS